MMTSRSNNNNKREAARGNSGFFLGENGDAGAFDFNEEKYREKQIQLANRCEDLTGVTFWETKGKFAEYDYHLCKDNDPKQFIGVATTVSGIPMFWQEINGIAELKYRTASSTAFKSTLIDADKLMKMNVRTRDMNMDCYVIWAFTDKDMFWKVDPALKFSMALGRNTQCSQDLPYEYKPQVFIPMRYLTPVKKEMFENGN